MLKNLQLENIGRFTSLEIEFNQITILIGPNDAGKSTILQAIACLNSGKINSQLRKEGTASSSITGTFDEYRLRLSVDDNGTILEFEQEGFADERIRNANKLDKSGLQALARELNITADGTKAEIQERIEATTTKSLIWTKANTSTIRPKIIIVNPRDPIPILSTILSRKIRALVVENPSLTTQINIIKTAFENTATDLITQGFSQYAKNHLPWLDHVSPRVDIQIERMCALTDLELHRTDSNELLTQAGNGTKHRIGLAATVWDSIDDDNNNATIQLYDEPETSLHYNAQQTLLNVILKLSQHEQRIISTHSPLFIDRFPMNSIRMLADSADSTTPLKSWADIDHLIGLRNTAILFEKRFLLVEGPTEHNFFHAIYHSLINRSLEEDGVVIINLETCGAWKSVCSALFNSRLLDVRILLDRDCQKEGSTAQVSKDKILNTNLFKNTTEAKAFLDQQVAFIGVKEFEDFIPADDWLEALESEFNFETNILNSDIEALKKTPKFSDELVKSLRQNVKTNERSEITKPFLGQILGKWYSNNPTRIPVELKQLGKWVSPNEDDLELPDIFRATISEH